MTKGIILGLLFQVTGAVGYIFIGSVTSIKNEVLKACLTLAISGLVAVGIVVFLLSSGGERPLLTGREWLYLAIGSLFVLVIGQILYIAGLSASNLTTMAYTALAYPAVALVLELILGRVRLSTLGIRDLAGLALLAAGYVLLISKK